MRVVTGSLTVPCVRVFGGSQTLWEPLDHLWAGKGARNWKTSIVLQPPVAFALLMKTDFGHCNCIVAVCLCECAVDLTRVIVCTACL